MSGERPKCLNCGKTLREHTGYIERLATAAEVEAREKRQREIDKLANARRKADQEGRHIEAAQLDAKFERLVSKRTRTFFTRDGKHWTVDTPPNGQFGQDGMGLFCKRACGEAFGVAAARAGYRRVRVA